MGGAKGRCLQCIVNTVCRVACTDCHCEVPHNGLYCVSPSISMRMFNNSICGPNKANKSANNCVHTQRPLCLSNSHLKASLYLAHLGNMCANGCTYSMACLLGDKLVLVSNDLNQAVRVPTLQITKIRTCKCLSLAKAMFKAIYFVPLLHIHPATSKVP